MAGEINGAYSWVWFWEAEAMVMTDITSAPDTTHHHVAVQLVCSLGGPIEMWTDATGWVEARGTIVATDVEHGIDSRGETAFGGWIDPSSHAGRALREAHLSSGPLSVLDDDLVDEVVALAPSHPEVLSDPAKAFETWERVLEVVTDLSRGDGPVDPRVLEVLRRVDGLTRLPPVSELATQVGLSVSRLQHLIRSEVGMSLRRWVLWRRTLAATALMLEDGLPIAEVAHTAGFSDAAHFTRSFSSFFAFPPSVVAGDPRFVGRVASRLDLRAWHVA